MDNNKIWQTVLADLQLQVTQAVYRTLISQTSLESITDTLANINCANPMLLTIIEKKYKDIIKKTLDNYTGKNLDLVFSSKKASKNGTLVGPLFTLKLPPQSENKSAGIKLNPDYTFNNYAVSNSNQMAYAAATQVGKNPATSYNPLFLYGGTGVGKTHLMQGIGNYIWSKNPKSRLLYCTGEEFTNEIIEAISTKTTVSFKKRYRHVDVLLIDDIQFIAGKYSIQEEFFHTFNAIYQAKKQIVLTSDRPPEEIKKLEDRLRSRFESGLTIDIGNPDFELRTAIILIKAKQRGFELSIESAKLISANVENARKLEGILTRIMSESQTRNIPITTEFIKKILGNAFKSAPVNKKVAPDTIIKTVADHYHLKISQLKSDKRDRIFALPRQILYYLLRTESGINLLAIGELLGGRDHTTVMHGIRKINHLLSTDDVIRGDILGIKNELVD